MYVTIGPWARACIGYVTGTARLAGMGWKGGHVYNFLEEPGKLICQFWTNLNK